MDESPGIRLRRPTSRDTRILALSLAVLAVVGRRLLASIPVLLGVTLLTFGLVNLVPGSAAQRLLGAEATPQQVAQLEEALNLRRPAWEQYWDWLRGALTGDFGVSLASEQSVTALLLERLPLTIELVILALVLALLLAVPSALLAARWPNRLADRLSMTVSMTCLSVPPYVLALLLVLLFAVNLNLFPSFGFTALAGGAWDNLRSLTLPALAIALPLAGFYARFLRGDLLEQLDGEDYIVTAKAKGLGPWRVLLGHALPNSLFGLLTLVGLNFGTLVGGTVIVEQIFALPGSGQLLLQAINIRDVPVLQAIVLVFAVATVAANITVDLAYALLDPRTRYGGR